MKVPKTNRAATPKIERRGTLLSWLLQSPWVGDLHRAEDLLHDFFLLNWHDTIDRFDPSRASFLSFLKMRLRQFASRRLRRPPYNGFDELPGDLATAAPALPDDEVAQREESRAWRAGFEAALAELRGVNPRHAEAIVLRHLLDLTPTRAAAMMGLTYRAFNTTVCRARRWLRRRLSSPCT